MCARPCFALRSKLAVGNIQVRVALFIRWPHFGWIRLKTDLAGSKTLSTTIVRLHSSVTASTDSRSSMTLDPEVVLAEFRIRKGGVGTSSSEPRTLMPRSKSPVCRPYDTGIVASVEDDQPISDHPDTLVRVAVNAPAAGGTQCRAFDRSFASGSRRCWG